MDPAADNGLTDGEFWAVMHKAKDAGVVFEEWTIANIVRGFPLTPEERAEAARKSAETLAEILALRAGRAA